ASLFRNRPTQCLQASEPDLALYTDVISLASHAAPRGGLRQLTRHVGRRRDEHPQLPRSGQPRAAAVEPASGRDHAVRIQPASERVRAVIDRLFADDAMPDAEVRHTVRTISISPLEGEALTRWVLRERATRTIEIGLGFGVAALYLCDGLIRSGDPHARHVALDPFQSQGFANRGLRALEEAGVASMVEFHDEPSQTALPAFLKD